MNLQLLERLIDNYFKIKDLPNKELQGFSVDNIIINAQDIYDPLAFGEFKGIRMEQEGESVF